MISTKLQKYSITPIEFNYNVPSIEAINYYKNNDEHVAIINSDKIKVENIYYKLGFDGTSQLLTTRKSVLVALEKIANELPSDSCLKIFDAFRSKKTQLSLFFTIMNKIKEINPSFSKDELLKTTRKFCADPRDAGHYIIPPHNTGGSIDLTISYKNSSTEWDMGGKFDCDIAAETIFLKMLLTHLLEYLKLNGMK